MHDMQVELLRTCQHSFGSENCHRLSCRPCKPCFSKFLRSPLGTSHSSTAMSHQPRCASRLVPLMRSVLGPGPPRQGPKAPLRQSMLAAPILRPLLRLREELSQSLGTLLSETAGLRLDMFQGHGASCRLRLHEKPVFVKCARACTDLREGATFNSMHWYTAHPENSCNLKCVFALYIFSAGVG